MNRIISKIVAGIEMITHQIQAMAKIPKFSTLYILGFYDPTAFAGYIKNIEKTFDITVKYACNTSHCQK